MKTTLDTLKEIDSQLKRIRNIIAQKSYMGAGIILDLYIGDKYQDNQSNNISGIEISILSGESEEELLALIEKTLMYRHNFYLAELHKESKKINNYLNEKT